jgi:phosphatidylglycerophosphate synthase
MSDNPNNSYQYNCIDKSIILPYFKQYYVSLYFRLVPRQLTANIITVLSTILVLLMLIGSFLYDGSVWLPLFFAICIHGYVVGDHLDGMQAKETKTGSPLGEFLDHYLDIYNGAVVLLVIIRLLGNMENSWFYFIVWTNFLAFSYTMVEELETGQLVFGKIGTLEGIILLIVFLISWSIPELRALWSAMTFWGYKAYWIVIIAMVAGYILTIIDIRIRMNKFSWHFIVYFFGSGILSIALFLSKLDQTLGWFILTVYSGEYIGKVMRNYLVQVDIRIINKTSIILPAILLLISIFKWLPEHYFNYLVMAVACYWTIKVIMVFSDVFCRLNQYWYWINPDQN